MSDEETRQKRADKMKQVNRRNYIARDLLDRRGPFRPKVKSPKKGVYDRNKNKIDVRRIDKYEDGDF